MFSFKEWARRVSTVTAATAAGALALSGVAVADTISNSIDTSVDAVAEVMPLAVGGPNGTTQLYVSPANDDGKNGCNLTGSTKLVLAVDSSNTSAATVSPSSVTFESCSDKKTLTVTPVAAGSTTVSVSQTSNTTDGSFDLLPAKFDVNVTGPANTAPVLTVGGVDAGGSYNKGSVPAATCEVSDKEDGNKSFAASLSAITGTYASDGLGSQTATCSYTDAGGLTASASKTYSIIDASAPVIGHTLTPATPDGDNGWYRGNVTLAWSVSEPQSPSSLQKIDCVDQNIAADQQGTPYSCSASSAGGDAGPVEVSIKRDGTAPTVGNEVTVTGTEGANGWFTSDVDVTFDATDTVSGLVVASKTVTSTGQGDAVTVDSPAFTDRAGNTVPEGAVTKTFKIDKAAPNAPRVSVTPAPNDAGWNKDDVLVSFAGNGDNGPSEVARCTADVLVTAESDGQQVSGACTDNAGNVSDLAQVTVKLDKTGPVITEAKVVAGQEGTDGWYTSDVTVEFTARDVMSGLETTTGEVKSSGEGDSVTVESPAFTDRAGNTTPVGALKQSFKIDKTAPNAPKVSVTPVPNAAGWNNEDVVVSFAPNGDSGGSGVVDCTAPVTVTEETEGRTVSGTCTDAAGNLSEVKAVTVQLDKTRPVITTATVDREPNAAGWYKGDVEVTFTATDALSGLVVESKKVTSNGEGVAVAVESPAFTDRAGNTVAEGAVTKVFKIDKTAPATPTIVGGANGDVYFGSVPAQPTCESSDALSGLASCVVTGHSSSIGTHTYTATATDVAGHTSTATRTYTVLPWTTKGFFAPVDMSTTTTTVYNTVKGGSTVPLKFELFAGSTELTSTSSVKSFTTQKITCTGTGMEDAIELTTTGDTSLRYDTTGGQFVQNWKTPTGAGTCYRATMTAQDGSAISAFFKLK